MPKPAARMTARLGLFFLMRAFADLVKVISSLIRPQFSKILSDLFTDPSDSPELSARTRWFVNLSRLRQSRISNACLLSSAMLLTVLFTNILQCRFYEHAHIITLSMNNANLIFGRLGFQSELQSTDGTFD